MVSTITVWASPPSALLFSLFFILIECSFFIAKSAAEPTPVGGWSVQPVSTNVDKSGAFNNSINDAICNPPAGKAGYYVYHVGPPNATAGNDYGLTVTSMLSHLSLVHMKGVAVRFEAGVYEIRSPIIVPSRTCIMGRGSGMNGTRLVATKKMADALIRSEATANINVARLSIDSVVSYELDYGAWFKLSNYVKVDDVKVARVKYDGVRVEGSGIQRWVYHTVLTGLKIYDVGRYGIAVSQACNTHVTDITVGNARKYGILLSAGDNITYISRANITGAEVALAIKQGRGLEGPVGVRVDTVNISGARKAAVWIKRSADVTFKNVNIAGGDTCYRVNQSSMKKMGGSCTAKRQMVGIPLSAATPPPA